MKVSNVTVRRRLFLALIICTILFAALLIRLGYVQLWKGPELAQRAEDSWRRNIPFAAKRGELWDRNGVRLAYNVTSPSIMAIPAQVKDADTAARELSRILEMGEESIKEYITKKEKIIKINPGGRKITEEKAEAVRQLKLPGIIVAEDNKRYYPFGSFASHIMGFTGIDNQGLTGIELSFNKELSGIQGNIAYLADARGGTMPNSSDQFMKPRDGLNLQLTIDKQIQSFMERELDQAMLQFQAKHVIGIAMDPNTGEILAMSSRPTYDPTNFRDYPTEVYNRNLPIWMTYEPGSTFKIITLAAAIEEKKVDLKNDSFYDPGFIEVGGAKLRCWKRGGHGSQTFLQVVENSCNPGFVVLGQRLGKEKLFDYIYNFGFGKKTGIDLGGEENGIMFKPSR
ncbi:MAG: spoVD, partial [Paenibacillus sp.]|nr:spoVD [Paenibacillus sp.]